jgi:hypothetical protein
MNTMVPSTSWTFPLPDTHTIYPMAFTENLLPLIPLYLTTPVTLYNTSLPPSVIWPTEGTHTTSTHTINLLRTTWSIIYYTTMDMTSPFPTPPLPQTKTKPPTANQKWARFTYIGPETRFIIKLFRHTSVNVAYTTKNTIQRHLSTPLPTSATNMTVQVSTS